MKPPTPVAVRLARRSHPQEDGCLVFDGYVMNSGYATIWDEKAGAKRLAHRVAHELYIGPIPDGYQVDHLCVNRLCVNPAHLEAVTAWENTMRSASVSALNARKTHCDRGHEFTPKNTRLRDGRKGRICRACDAIRAATYRERRAA